MPLFQEPLSSNDAFWQSIDISLLWKTLLVSMIVLNYKNLPLVFHARSVNAFRFVLRSQRTLKPGPSQLFQPLVTSSRAPLTEIDYNIHKSNSTYFSDLDIARSHLLCTLFSAGIEQARRTGAIQGGKGRFAVCLGAVSCSFRKEIKPYQRYEMWTRVLSWDHKWIYIVTHFVRKDGSENMRENLIVASALSKCVFKKGRWTIPPETMLAFSGLLPTRPEVTAPVHAESIPSPLPQASPMDDAIEMFFKAVERLDDIRMSIEAYLSMLLWKSRSEKGANIVGYSFANQYDEVDESTRESIECERQRGMDIANLLASLGSLETEFRATETLAKHRDL